MRLTRIGDRKGTAHEIPDIIYYLDFYASKGPAKPSLHHLPEKRNGTSPGEVRRLIRSVICMIILFRFLCFYVFRWGFDGNFSNACHERQYNTWIWVDLSTIHFICITRLKTKSSHVTTEYIIYLSFERRVPKKPHGSPPLHIYPILAIIYHLIDRPKHLFNKR